LVYGIIDDLNIMSRIVEVLKMIGFTVFFIVDSITALDCESQRKDRLYVILNLFNSYRKIFIRGK
jgi:uncharacterized protein (DUF302 family)